MTSMHSRRERAFFRLRSAVANSDTVDVLLRKSLQIISSAYDVVGLLWLGFEEAAVDGCRALATAQAWDAFGDSRGHSEDGSEVRPMAVSGIFGTPGEGKRAAFKAVRRYRPTVLPDWLLQQQETPHIEQLTTGDLIIPVLDAVEPEDEAEEELTAEPAEAFTGLRSGPQPGLSDRPISGSLKFIFQFRPRPQSPLTDGEPWASDVIESLQMACHQVMLMCDTLAWKRRYEQAQRHTSLLSRTSHLLNSTLPPDLIVKQALSEMGQTIRCDRAVLFDLRNESVNSLATWDRARSSLQPFEPGSLTPDLWQDTIDLFLQGGASYVELALTEPEPEPLPAWMGRCGAGSALVLPVYIREDFFGVIVLLSTRQDRSYLLDELQMAGQSAEQMAIALALIQTARHSALTRDSLPQPSALLQEQLQDSITDLPNQDALEQQLEQLSTPSVWAFHAPFSLIVCDLDYFKLINDTHGYDVGDRVLRRLAQHFQKQLRRNTPLFRYGGEEFAILLEETEMQEAKEVAERLRRSLRSLPLRVSSGPLTITASFGVAQQDPERDRHAVDVLQRAERAVSEAKMKGRDRVEML